MADTVDEYEVLTGPGTYQFREKASRFIALSFPVKQEADCRERLLEIKLLHPQATHHCYAYRLGLHGEKHRANDDGEPSGTAGKPILSQLQSAGLSDSLIIVVRYYGGTPLGASGLISAYKKAASEVLKLSQKGKRILQQKIRLHFHPEYLAELHQILRKYDWKMLSESFDEEYTLLIEVRKSQAVQFHNELTENYILNQNLHRENTD